VNTDDTPTSGSRWEPTPPPADATAPEPEAKPGVVTRGKLALVAGAVGLVAAGGIGGFVLGQSSSATAGTGTDQTGTRPGFDGGEGGFPGGQLRGGQLPGGQQPGGQQPSGPISGSTGTGSDPTT
jgi:hypothetical protein